MLIFGSPFRFRLIINNPIRFCRGINNPMRNTYCNIRRGCASNKKQCHQFLENVKKLIFGAALKLSCSRSSMLEKVSARLSVAQQLCIVRGSFRHSVFCFLQISNNKNYRNIWRSLVKSCFFDLAKNKIQNWRAGTP